jgi:hypothetical protein
MRRAQALMALALCLFVAIFIFWEPKHVGPKWSVHAQMHLVQGQVWMLGLCGVNLVLIFIPLAQSRSWAWWTLTGSGIVLLGGYFGPIVFVAPWEPSVVDGAVFGLLAILYAAGLVIARRKIGGHQ